MFVYDGREFPDPDPSLSVEDVRKQLSDFFPGADQRRHPRGAAWRRRGPLHLRTAHRHQGRRRSRHRDDPPSGARSDLAVFDLAAELLDTDGELDAEAAAARQPEINLAVAEAEAYAARDALSGRGAPPHPAALIVRPTALGQALRRTPVTPTSVAALLDGHAAQLEFRRIVEEIFPDGCRRDPGRPSAGRTARADARGGILRSRRRRALSRVRSWRSTSRSQAACPFVRNGWSYERHHDLDLHAGELLLSALCAPAYDDGARLALLDAAEQHVPRACWPPSLKGA